jgi:hypothetical protein
MEFIAEEQRAEMEDAAVVKKAKRTKAEATPND